MLRSGRGSLYALMGLSCLASVAAAQPPGGPPRGGRGPGGPPDAGAVFDRIDADGDGSISRREFAKAHEELMGRIGEGFRHGPPPGFGRGSDRDSGPGQRRPQFGSEHRRPPFPGRGPRDDDERRSFDRPVRNGDDHRDYRMSRERDDGDHRAPRPPFADHRRGDDDNDRGWDDRDGQRRGPPRPMLGDAARRRGLGGPPDRHHPDDDDDDRPRRDRDDD